MFNNSTINKMKLESLQISLLRIKTSEKFGTYGKLYLNGVYFCDTIEPYCPYDREKKYSLDDVKKTKQSFKDKNINTSIPYGTYEIVINASKKYGKLMPLLLDTPAFLGVRIHSGNTVSDTLGCILVGHGDANKWQVINSRRTYNILYENILYALSSRLDVKINVV